MVLSQKSGERTDVAPRGQSAPSGSYLSVGLYATTPSAHSVELRTLVSILGSAEVDATIAWGDGTTDTFSATVLGYPSDIRYTKHTYPAVGSYDVKVTVKDTAQGLEAVNEVRVVTSGSEFTPHQPTRLLDTREGIGTAKAKVAGRSSVALKVAGAAQIPAGVSVVVLNVTVTNTTAAGFVSVQAEKDFAERAETSNLNYVAGQSVPNLVVVTVGEGGYVHLFNGGGEAVDLVSDVTGFFTPAPASGYRALPSVRAVDTREGLGTARGPVPGRISFDTEIAGRHGVPRGVTAVALNLTVTAPQAAGYLTVYPSGQAVPSTSSLNFTAGQSVANAVIVPVGPDGKISVLNGSGRAADVVVDVVGYYTPDSRSAFVSAWVPFRIVDSRKDSWGRKAGQLPARSFCDAAGG
ncbi:PKD domain-containing protein [Kitasatospora gansuensis]